VAEPPLFPPAPLVVGSVTGLGVAGTPTVGFPAGLGPLQQGPRTDEAEPGELVHKGSGSDRLLLRGAEVLLLWCHGFLGGRVSGQFYVARHSGGQDEASSLRAQGPAPRTPAAGQPLSGSVGPG